MMSYFPPDYDSGKRCLVYCGDARCNCSAWPDYKAPALSGSPQVEAGTVPAEIARLIRDTYDPTMIKYDGQHYDDNADEVAAKIMALTSPTPALEDGLAKAARYFLTEFNAFWNDPNHMEWPDAEAYSYLRHARNELEKALRPREQEGGEAPTGWIKGHISPSTPDGPAEYDVDFVYGDDPPEPTGWTALYRHPPLPADGWKEGVEAAAKVCQQWLDNYSTLAIDHSTPREYATDAVLDIKEVIEGLLKTPPASTEGEK